MDITFWFPWVISLKKEMFEFLTCDYLVSESQKAKGLPWPGCYKLFPMFSCDISLSCYRDGRVVSITFHYSRSISQDGGCSVLTCTERWGQDVLIYNACYCDLQQQSNCCGDKRKQSAAHPHTAGSCWTKEDYLHWYNKQHILFLKLK